MTNEEYENELKDLLDRKAANKREATDLDDMLVKLRHRRDNPTYEQMLMDFGEPVEFGMPEPASAFAKRD